VSGLILLTGATGYVGGRLLRALEAAARPARHGAAVPGDTVDFWRVEAVDPGRLLRLRAEMRLPGRAWLQFEVEPDGEGRVIHQTAMLDPVGLSGLAYWYTLWPLHQVVFRGMLRGIAQAAERELRLRGD
jgi:hypothetical protein